MILADKQTFKHHCSDSIIFLNIKKLYGFMVYGFYGHPVHLCDLSYEFFMIHAELGVWLAQTENS